MKRMTTLIDCPPPMLTANGKRRGRKPGANSTLAQRSAANSRERSRMRVLASAFVDLKGALPWVPKDTKLSKLDTLKLAASYIAYLKKVMDEDPTASSAGSIAPYDYKAMTQHPIVYTWPFNMGKSSSGCLVAKSSPPPMSTAPLADRNPNSAALLDHCASATTSELVVFPPPPPPTDRSPALNAFLAPSTTHRDIPGGMTSLFPTGDGLGGESILYERTFVL